MADAENEFGARDSPRKGRNKCQDMMEQDLAIEVPEADEEWVGVELELELSQLPHYPRTTLPALPKRVERTGKDKGERWGKGKAGDGAGNAEEADGMAAPCRRIHREGGRQRYGANPRRNRRPAIRSLRLVRRCSDG